MADGFWDRAPAFESEVAELRNPEGSKVEPTLGVKVGQARTRTGTEMTGKGDDGENCDGFVKYTTTYSFISDPQDIDLLLRAKPGARGWVSSAPRTVAVEVGEERELKGVGGGGGGGVGGKGGSGGKGKGKGDGADEGEDEGEDESEAGKRKAKAMCLAVAVAAGLGAWLL